MAYPLPSMSTISAALSTDALPIAPELLENDGMPQDDPAQSQEAANGNKRRGSDHYDDGPPHDSSSYGGGFQNSAARDEGDRTDWMSSYGQSAGMSMHPWEEGYREAENQPAEADAAESTEESKPRKRPRQSKTKAKEKENPDNTLEEGYEYDYEDPSRDVKAGAIFRHPLPGAPQACIRCHRIKRKCDNARPRCAGCSKSDVACVFELSPATSSYIHHLKGENLGLTSQIASAHDRIVHLEAVVSALERGLPPPASPPPAGRGSEDPTQSDFAALARTVLSIRSSNTMDPLARSMPLTASSSHASGGGLYSHANPPAQLPQYEIAKAATEAFFISNAISYPFLDKHEFLRDLDWLYDRASKTSNGWSANDQSEEVHRSKEFIFFMVVAIGTTHRERVGEAERGASKTFRRTALSGLPYAVAREDILCVQSLLLLAVYSMLDPSDMSLWHIVGFAARIAIALNLHRKVEDPNMPPAMVEQRRRVFYGLYNIERLVATTLSRPLVFTDDDIDVELPSPLPSDPPYRGIPQMLFTQHIIKLRRLAGAVLTTAYSVSGAQNQLTEQERANIVIDFHSRFDTWLAESPIPPTQEEEKPGMINNHSWFLINYHHCLCLLYRPCPLYPITTPQRLSALYDASSRCVDLWLELWPEQKIAYSIINVSAQFLDCISLLYCLCEYDNRSPNLHSDDNWRREVSTRVRQCHELLEAFGRALPETAKYKEIFGKLSEMLLARHGSNATALPAQQMPVAPGPPLSSAPQSSLPTPAASTSFSTIDLQNLPLLSPNFSTQANGQNGAINDEDTAWNAMTRLWHNAGDFNFDESIFGQINDERLLGLDMSSNSNSTANRGPPGLMGTSARGNAGVNGQMKGFGQGSMGSQAWNGMLWNQIG